MIEFKSSMMKGCSKRTFVDDNQQKVYRRFGLHMRDKLKVIERITEQLMASDIPVESSINGVQESDSFLFAEYQYYKLSDDDFQGGIYSPELKEQRLRNIAKLFVEFQITSTDIEGPLEALDHPSCNTLNWINTDNPSASLLGTVYESLEIIDVLEGTKPAFELRSIFFSI